MDKQSRTYQAYVQILKEELIPAMGCTEPIAIAYAAANGVSEVDETIHIERGYENIVEKLQALGADIRRVEIPANAVSRAI